MESKETRYFLDELSLQSRECYDFYRENRKKVADGLNDFNLFKKAVSGLMKIIRYGQEETEGGTYIEGWGYFCMVAYPNKKCYRGKAGLIRNNTYKTEYFPYFFPDTELPNWSMSETFNDNTCLHNLDYKLYFNLCKSLKTNFHFSKQQSHSPNRIYKHRYR